MGKYLLFIYYYISINMILFSNLINCSNDDSKEVYIVYLGSIPKEKYCAFSQHMSLMHQISTNNSVVADSFHRSYQRSFNGFAAKLTKDEAKQLSNNDEVVSIFPSRNIQLQTTRSWDFLGFDVNHHHNMFFGSDIIIGVIDSGIWPELESFSDKGYPPPPKRWRGSCEMSKDFKSNKKIIGARHYSSNSTRDSLGHGSHTASIVAGNKVNNVSFYGLANGTARGGLFNGRIAMYKACDKVRCATEDILAAFDDAIADGVDIITISIASTVPNNFFSDVIAIGAFHAFERGIITIQAAGNYGPYKYSVSSVAPWILSVAASSTDRKIIDKLLLGDGRTLVGSFINTFSLNKTMFPLIYGYSASKSNCTSEEARSCYQECLSSSLVKGKILLCDVPIGVGAASQVGAAGMIAPSEITDYSESYPLPALLLNQNDYDIVKSYINSSENPQGFIFKSQDIKNFNSAIVASFSSRGPNAIVPEILKPDITAPGVEILAAYSPVAPPSLVDVGPQDKRRVNYNILSGTSMACPHVAGVAAYIKSIHYEWSPSAIKSAIMTTASTMSPIQNILQEFSYGSGQINPLKTVDPGLVYEISKDDYINFLCGMNYNDTTIRKISGENSSCPKGCTGLSPRNLNYPSMTAEASDKRSFKFEFYRTVTNVGFKNSTYQANIFTKSQLIVKVIPEVLSFTSLHEKQSFVVTVSGKEISKSSILTASLEWFDGIHSVRSPIVIYSN